MSDKDFCSDPGRGHTLIHTSGTRSPVGRRFEHDGYAATAASRTHEARLQAREREVRASRANQGVEVELLAIGASPHGLRALAIAVGAPHVHPPAEASRDA